jgi:hypothetical protein
LFFGGLRALYHFQGNFGSNDTIGYYRVILEGGKRITQMRTFVEALGGGPGSGKNIRMGIYTQTDPMDPTLSPNAKVAETAEKNLAGVSSEFVTEPLLANYTPPVTGWYWLAIACESAGITFRATGPYPAGFEAAQEESTTGTTLPATAASAELETAALYVGAVEG